MKAVAIVKFPRLAPELLLKRLVVPETKVNMVLDTDTYNEVDDQFALVYALLSTERLNLEAVYAAPFFNTRSSSPQDGMEKSFEEIHRVLDKLGIKRAGNFVCKGSTGYLEDLAAPCRSEAAADLIERAMASEEPLYVVAVGAITNIASALLLEPRLVEKIVVVWLGGNSLYWPTAKEFNLGQDILASRLVFDCGVPLVHLPCQNVVTHLATTVAELERYIDGQSAIGTYLTDIVREYVKDRFAASKVIWDVAAVAYLVNPAWVLTHIVPSPILTDQVTWSEDKRRHFIKTAYQVHRDSIFADLFQKIRSA
ncbi:MAG TPA: nucleoside hydrolase [Firmicutes bacterium]|nr:nucleoside hydrolase [Bacillota bacterium]